MGDDLKLTDGAGVAMTMLARTATSSSAVTHSSIFPGASPRAAAAAKDLVLSSFLAMNPESAGLSKATPVKEEMKHSQKDKDDTGRCSPRAPSGHGGGGLLQELNGVTQISPSGRTAHLSDWGPAHVNPQGLELVCDALNRRSGAMQASDNDAELHFDQS